MAHCQLETAVRADPSRGRQLEQAPVGAEQGNSARKLGESATLSELS